MWTCAVCGKMVFPNERGEPDSLYWKGSPTHVEYAFCSPECSLIDYTEKSSPSSKHSSENEDNSKD